MVLTGALDDGASGLVAIKREGGLALIQDPKTAMYSSMPRAALSYVDADACLPVAKLAGKIVSLTQTEASMPETSHDTADLEREVKIAGLDLSVIDDDQRQGTLVAMTCPECHGPLWEIADGGPARYWCRVGHAYTAEALDSGLVREAEDALWTALNTLEESAKLYTYLAAQATASKAGQRARRFEQSAQRYKSRADAIRKLLEDSTATSVSDEHE